jgi:hypothetical protein
MARREERAYREYVSDEQRSQAGCIGVQSGAVIRGRVLSFIPVEGLIDSITSSLARVAPYEVLTSSAPSRSS